MMTKTRCLLFAILAAAASTRRVAHGLSRNSIPNRNVEIPPITTKDSHRHDIVHEIAHDSVNDSVQSRKQAITSMGSILLAGLAVNVNPSPSFAFDRSFPDELTDNDDSQQLGVLIGKRSTAQQRKLQAEESKQQMDRNLSSFSLKKDLLPSATWGLAIFFASGSRSNPLATPLANLLYDPKNEQWLEERNKGLFSAPPLEFLALLGVVFLVLGAVTEYALLQLSSGDSVVCGQLAGVALINGGFFEIGRIASGEKGLTRDENDRAVQLEDEFEEFAEKRLMQGGNCHRSDVVKSFRRYFAKYRQADSEQYPLTDREIERLLRVWNKTTNMGRAEMRSTGFYYGIQINTDADVFA